MSAAGGSNTNSPQKRLRPKYSLTEITPSATENVNELAAAYGFPCVRCSKRVFLTKKSKNATVEEKLALKDDEVKLSVTALCCRYKQFNKCQHCKGTGKQCYQLKREDHAAVRPLLIYGLAALGETLKKEQEAHALGLQHAAFLALEGKHTKDQGPVLVDTDDELDGE